MSLSYDSIGVRPVTPIGAEVSDIDITRPLSNRQVDELHRALADHQVLDGPARLVSAAVWGPFGPEQASTDHAHGLSMAMSQR